ncbi:MAG: hypothetical protein IPL39_23935 [Opitutaceae bacterium]|nr:hypothetical protein [Opitutaceae bacterium]
MKRPLEKEGAGPQGRGLLAKSEPSRMVEALTQTTKKGDQHMKKHDRFIGLDVHSFPVRTWNGSPEN